MVAAPAPTTNAHSNRGWFQIPPLTRWGGSELADVDQAVLGAEEVHEGAELHHLDHGALVDLADFRIGSDRLDPLDGGLHRFAVVGGDLHSAVVLDVDLGAGLFHDLANH